MDNALYYLALNRQRGLAAEMTATANNVANMATVGYRREGLVFSEFVRAGGGVSISMADLNGRYAAERPGKIARTGGRFDIAIDGPGFLVLETAQGPILTRAGALQRSRDGLLTAADGAPILGLGEAPIAIPDGTRTLAIGKDGTVSADGEPLGQILVVDAPAEALRRRPLGRFATEVPLDPVPNPSLVHGALEASNVDPVEEIARMIAVSRAYEQAQALIEDEDERMRDTIETLGNTR